MISNREVIRGTNKTQVVWRCPVGCDYYYGPLEEGDGVTQL